MIKRICLICKKEFFVKPVRLRMKYKPKYCSYACKGHAMRLKKSRHNGYIRIYAPYHPYADIDGNVYEHRLIMENKLKRFLKPCEDVHHINGIRSDNREENLEYFISRSDHMKKHCNAKGKTWKWRKNASNKL